MLNRSGKKNAIEISRDERVSVENDESMPVFVIAC